jgi:hypothetical protein
MENKKIKNRTDYNLKKVLKSRYIQNVPKRFPLSIIPKYIIMHHGADFQWLPTTERREGTTKYDKDNTYIIIKVNT